MKTHILRTVAAAALLLVPMLLSASGYSTLRQHESEVNARLENAGLPSSLAFLPVLLTGCDNGWTGARAAGAWALPDAAARHYGLAVSASYDPRRDFLCCTDAAVAYLKDLYASEKEDLARCLTLYFRAAGRPDLAFDGAGAVGRLSELASQYAAFDGLPAALAEVKLEKPVLVDDLCAAVCEGQAAFYETNPLVVCGAVILPAGATVRIPEGASFASAAADLYASAEAYEKGELASYKSRREEIKPSTEVQRPAKTVQKPQYTYYTVKKGDVLGKIASRHHTTVQKIMKANALKSPDRIREGQKLKIPR